MTQGTLDRPKSSTQRMQCMEVWGGNTEVEQAFEMPGLQAWVYSRPHARSAMGGDVYYMSSCASGRISRMLLADVSGHGPEVADLARGLRDLMRKQVNMVKQTRFVEGMNRQFMQLSKLGSFATAVVATFFQPARRLTISNAGHPHPLFFRASDSRWSGANAMEASEPGLSNLPLGLHDQTTYTQTELKLEAGDMVLMFSDALPESLDARGKMLGTEGCLRLVNELYTDSPAELPPRLLATVESNHPENVHRDDLTIMLCRATGTTTTLRDNLLAPLRLFRPVGDRTTWRA